MKEAYKLYHEHPLEQPIFATLSVRPTVKPPETPLLDPHSASPRTGEDSAVYHKAILRRMDFVLDLESAKSFPRKVEVTYSWGPPDYEYSQFIHRSGFLLAQITNDGKSDFILTRNPLASQWSTSHGKPADLSSGKLIVRDFVKFCKNESALKLLYQEVSRPKVSPLSPMAKNPFAADADVPPMELPANVTRVGQWF